MSKRKLKCEASQRTKRSRGSAGASRGNSSHDTPKGVDATHQPYSFEDAARDAQEAEGRDDDEPNSFLLRFQNRALVAALFDYRRRLKRAQTEITLSERKSSVSVTCLTFVEQKWQQLGSDLGDILRQYLGAEMPAGGCAKEGSHLLLDTLLAALPQQAISAIVSDDEEEEDDLDVEDEEEADQRKLKLKAFEVRVEEMSGFTTDVLTRVCRSLKASSGNTSGASSLRAKRQINAALQALRSKHTILKKRTQDLETQCKQAEEDRARAYRVVDKRRALITPPPKQTSDNDTRSTQHGSTATAATAGNASGNGGQGGKHVSGGSAAARGAGAARGGTDLAAGSGSAAGQATAQELANAQTQCKMRLAEIEELRREVKALKMKCVQAANEAAAVLPPHLQEQRSAAEDLAALRVRHEGLKQTRQAQIDVARREGNERAEQLQNTLDDTQRAITESFSEHEGDRAVWSKDRRALALAIADVKKFMKRTEVVEAKFKELQAMKSMQKKAHAAEKVQLKQQIAGAKLAAEKLRDNAGGASEAEEDTNEELYGEIESIAAAFEEIEEQNEKLLTQVDKLEKCAATYVQKKIKVDEKLMDLQDQQVALERVRLEQQSVLRLSEDAIEANEAEAESLRLELAQCKDVNGQQRETVEGLHTQCRESTSKGTIATAHLDAARKRIVTLTDRVADLTDDVEEQRSNCKRLEENNENLKRRCEGSEASSMTHSKSKSNSSQHHHHHPVVKHAFDFLCDLANTKEELKETVQMKFKHFYCSVCESNLKDMVIIKCFHTFCKDCIGKNLSTRHRKCATCGVSFGASDVRRIY